MIFSRKILLAAGATAMLVTTPMPVFAAQMGSTSANATSAEILHQTADGHRRRWRHRDRVDGGDILTGIGILAGIAIIAGAASDADKRDRDDRRYEPPRDDRRDDAPVYRDDDLGSAVSTCTNAAERSVGTGARVSEIRSVTSEGNGWRVEGNLNDDSFTCATTNGQVDYIRINDR